MLGLIKWHRLFYNNKKKEVWERESEEKRKDMFLRTGENFALQIHKSVVRIGNKTT